MSGAHVGGSKLSVPWITAWGEHGLAGDGDLELLDSGSWDALLGRDALWGREAECAVTSVCIRCEGLDRAQQLWEDLVAPVGDCQLPLKTPWQWATQNDWDTSQTQSIIAAKTRRWLGRVAVSNLMNTAEDRPSPPDRQGSSDSIVSESQKNG
jgi:hypothetical protein